ncbi:MAG: pilus assembly protein PilP [Chromatiales bacterium]|nr:MAG: pilus assembly protein PilP [Chromatiales bacterium]
MKLTSLRRFVAVSLLAALAAGCGGDMDDLMKYVDDVKARPGGRIEPLPQIKPYQTFTYEAGTRRSPFVQESGPSTGQLAGPRPDVSRPKEYLEGFPLDTLNMVGTLEREGRTYGLVQTQDGLVHRVLPGNYVGQNDGRVVSVSEAGIQVEELVPDGIGGFFKRSAAISLD